MVSKRTKKLLVDSVGGSQDEYYNQRWAAESKRVSVEMSEGSSSRRRSILWLEEYLLTLLDYQEKLAESILVLHIATDLYIKWFRREGKKQQAEAEPTATATAAPQ